MGCRPGRDKEAPAFSLFLIELLWARLSRDQHLLLASLKRIGLLLAGLLGKNRWKVGLSELKKNRASYPPPLQRLQRSTHIQTLFESSNVTPECCLSQLISSAAQCRDLALPGTLNPTGPQGSTLYPYCRKQELLAMPTSLKLDSPRPNPAPLGELVPTEL